MLPAALEERRARLGYQPALDGVRGVAIALVVSWHAFGWPERGFLGVDMFFVLSGFLITTLLLQEWNRNGSISLSSFYLRRGLRLLPALGALLLAYVLLHLVRALVDPSSHDLSTALKGVLYSAFYVSNIAQAAGVILPVPLDHLWSLATEEQFYVIWPILLVAALRLGMRQRTLGALLVAAIALIALHRLHLSLSGAERARIAQGPDTRFDPLLVGCVLGLLFVGGTAPRALFSRKVLLAAAVPGLAAVAVPVLVTGPSSSAFNWSLVLPFALGTGLLIWALTIGEAGVVGRALAFRPLVGLGKVSYSLYLWHPLVIWVCLRFLGLPAAVGAGLALLVAIGSYRYVEQPFLRLKRRERTRIEGQARPAATSPVPGRAEQPAHASATSNAG